MTMDLIPQRETTVALLAEGVDRNLSLFVVVLPGGVALLAEGVDRNLSEAVNEGT